MGEREAQREREAESRPHDHYEDVIRFFDEARKRADSGKIVIRGKDTPWEQDRQGLLKYFLAMSITDTALSNWLFFLQEIHTHSGRHTHQGGLAIYVVEGKGYTTVNDRRVDWEEGDLILLPIVPDGVEHQHFNVDPDKPSTWLAIIPIMTQELLGSFVKQVTLSPDWERLQQSKAQH